MIEHKADKTDLLIISGDKAHKHVVEDHADKIAHLSVNLENKIL